MKKIHEVVAGAARQNQILIPETQVDAAKAIFGGLMYFLLHRFKITVAALVVLFSGAGYVIRDYAITNSTANKMTDKVQRIQRQFPDQLKKIDSDIEKEAK